LFHFITLALQVGYLLDIEPHSIHSEMLNNIVNPNIILKITPTSPKFGAGIAKPGIIITSN
jgi:hypothetical protein